MSQKEKKIKTSNTSHGKNPPIEKIKYAKKKKVFGTQEKKICRKYSPHNHNTGYLHGHAVSWWT